VAEEEVVSLAQRLIRVRTENPPGHTSAACNIVGDALGQAGFATEYIETGVDIVNLVATYRFSADGPTLLLCGHLDVVPPGEGWTRDPWGAESEGGKLYGRGAVDMKGSLAALVIAARDVAASRATLRGALVVAAVADEEEGGARGAVALTNQGKLAADGAIVAEPGDGGVVIANRGLCFVEITTHGKAAHASQPSAGVNAVERMLDTLIALRTCRLRHEAHALLSPPSIAIGTMISGGTKANVIPDSCRAMLDVRPVPGMSRATVLDDIRRHLHASGLGEQTEVEIVRWGDPGETPAESAIVVAACRAYEQEFRMKPTIGGISGYTDGGCLATRAGIPSVMAFGPGSVADCHIADECVSISQLQAYSRVYAGTIVNFLG
jgi:acetylornithine deacetylase/succinyl-diaminopimelate desuccinylase family protein